MATKYIYQVSRTAVIETDDYIETAQFYEDSELYSVASYAYEQTEDDRSCFEEFASVVNDNRFEDVVVINYENQTITLCPGFKEIWFAHQFEEFKKVTENLDLATFMNDRFEWHVRRLVGAAFDSFIYDQSRQYLVKIDSYFRELDLAEPVTFYFGGIVAFHN